MTVLSYWCVLRREWVGMEGWDENICRWGTWHRLLPIDKTHILCKSNKNRPFSQSQFRDLPCVLPPVSTLQDLHLNGLVCGKIYRNTQYLMGKSMVSCKFSPKPIHWSSLFPKFLVSNLLKPNPTDGGSSLAYCHLRWNWSSLLHLESWHWTTERVLLLEVKMAYNIIQYHITWDYMGLYGIIWVDIYISLLINPYNPI